MTKTLSNFPCLKKVRVGPSKIHGHGIVARKNINRGEIVFIIKGKLVIWQVKDEKTALHGANWVGVGRNKWIDPQGVTKYLNHSSNPNCGIRGRFMVCAMRDIQKGEEITIDYSITEETMLWWMKDNTAKGKIRIVRSIQHLPYKKYKKYLPYIPRYFQKIYTLYHNL